MELPKRTHCERCNETYKIHRGDYALYLNCENCGYFTYEMYQAGCCRHPQIVKVNKPNVNGNPSVKDCCLNCGNTGKTYKLNAVPDVSKLQVVDEEILKRLRQGFYDEHRRFNDWAKEQGRKAFLEQHDEYLKSPQWKALRDKVLTRDNYLCQSCLDAKATQVHHLTYERWQNEAAFDLTSVCNACHERIHRPIEQA